MHFNNAYKNIRYYVYIGEKEREESCTLISQEETWDIYTTIVIIPICEGTRSMACNNRNYKLNTSGANCCSVCCFRLWEEKIGLSKLPQSVQNFHLLFKYLSQRLFRGVILVDLVTLVVPDGHITILHFHLEQNVVLTEGAAICLAASTLPGDSLEAEDICTTNTHQQTKCFI